MPKEEAIKTLKENCCAMCAYGSQDMDSCDIHSCDNKDAIKALEQEPKTGHWIFVDKAHEHAHCSECDYGNVDLLDGRPHSYCPNCGCRMVEPLGGEK